MRKPLVFLLLTLVSSLVSCKRNKIQKTIAEIQKESQVTLNSGEEESKAREFEIDESNLTFVKLKTKVDFQSPIFSQAFPANIHIKQDSAIWISVAVGIEVGRALITQDSVKVMDRINRKYYDLSMTDLSRQFDFELSYELLESLILGDLPIDRSEADSISFNSLYTSLFQNQGSLKIENQVDNVSKKLITILAKDSKNGSRLGISYSDFVQVAEEKIPQTIFTKIDNTSKPGDPSTLMNLFHNKIDAGDMNLRFPYSIPKSYEKGFIEFGKK